MTREDTGRFLANIRKLYPTFHADGADPYLVDSWHAAFKGFSPSEADAALKDFFATNATGYAPKPGQLMAILLKEKDGAPKLNAYGCAYCRANGTGDGFIVVKAKGGPRSKDPYDVDMFTPCPCQLEARGLLDKAIAQKAAILRAVEKGRLPYAYTSQEVPEDDPAAWLY